jgi:NADH:ubiquinone oxidoreductase subunit 5 (subunit L)/multisubunit Na+/H+ antiporter MnhA subunit
LRLDGLSLTMLGVVTGVGFLIHLFASWYMRGEEGYSRFFSYMNLFVASMLCWCWATTCCCSISAGKGSACAATC